MKPIKNSSLSLAVGALLLSATFSQATQLWGIKIDSKSKLTPNDANITTTLATNVTGSDGSDIGGSMVGLDKLDMNAEGDTDADGTTETFYIRSRTDPAVSTVSDTNTGYWAFTISATNNFLLDLGSLTWDSARGGSSGERGFAVYADVGPGNTFVQLLRKTTPTETLTESRDNPESQSIDLTSYGDVDSITFRYYPLAGEIEKTIEVTNLQLNGELVPAVIPGPTSAALLGLGGITLFLNSSD